VGCVVRAPPDCVSLRRDHIECHAVDWQLTRYPLGEHEEQVSSMICLKPTNSTRLVFDVSVSCEKDRAVFFVIVLWAILFWSLAVLDPKVGHTMDILSPFICLLSFWLTLPQGVLSTYWCCPSRTCIVFLACVHLALFLALSLSPGNSLVSSWCDYSMVASVLWQCLTVSSLLQYC